MLLAIPHPSVCHCSCFTSAHFFTLITLSTEAANKATLPILAINLSLYFHRPKSAVLTE